MPEYVHLIGAEQVQRAGHQIEAAAEVMSRAAMSIESSVDRLVRALEMFAIATPTPAPAVAAITERQDSVHPAAPSSNVASLAPFSEPSACESSELPVRLRDADQA